MITPRREGARSLRDEIEAVILSWRKRANDLRAQWREVPSSLIAQAEANECDAHGQQLTDVLALLDREPGVPPEVVDDNGAERAKTPNEERPRAASGEQRGVPGETPEGAPAQDYKQRDIALLRKTLSMLCHFVWHRQTRPGEHMWSIPVDRERDFDCILSDAIDELEARRAAAILPETGRAPEAAPPRGLQELVMLLGCAHPPPRMTWSEWAEREIAQWHKAQLALVPPQETGRGEEGECVRCSHPVGYHFSGDNNRGCTVKDCPCEKYQRAAEAIPVPRGRSET